MKALDNLRKKHLFIIGGTAKERKQYITEIIENSNYETFRFPSGMQTLYDYLDFVRKKNLYTAWYEKKGKHGTNQVLEFHRDWLRDNKSLVVLEEIQHFEDNWKVELIRYYIDAVAIRKKGDTNIHLIISQEEERDLLEKLSHKISFPENYNRTRSQIVESAIKVIDISTRN